MPLWTRKKVPASREREERLRQARSESQPLRHAYPGVALVKVRLEFLPVTEPPHAAQSFVLYPAAQAFFLYPCPYGDCDGVFDFASDAKRATGRENARVNGTAKCAGTRCLDGVQRQPCGLGVSFTITAQLEVPSTG
jgi:hypothetical protein